MRKTIILSALVAAISITASQSAGAADAVPKYDIHRGCVAETEASAGIGETLESCTKAEEQARTELTQQWSTYATADKTTCSRSSNIDSTPSYVELETCLEMAAGAHGTTTGTGQRR